MLKRSMALIVLVFALLLAGCETAKGLGKGVYGVGSGVVGTAEGVGKDTYNFWNFLKSADSWMQDNLW